MPKKECNCADWGMMEHLSTCPMSPNYKPPKKKKCKCGFHETCSRCFNYAT